MLCEKFRQSADHFLNYMPTRPKDKEPKDESFEQGQEPIIIDDNIQDEGFSSADDEDCADDPVVKTYDVFLSNQLKDHIYLLQYPIRNPDEEYLDENAPLLARMKPIEGAMELDVPIDAINFSAVLGEKFAGSHNDSNTKSETKTFDCQRLSGKPQQNLANYFLGVMRGAEMHLSPVKAAVQLRPNFYYYDTATGGDKRKKPQTEDGPAKQPRAVQLQMKNTEDIRDPRNSTSQYSTSTEEFVKLDWVDTLNPETLAISDRLVSLDTSKEFVSSMTKADFVGQLIFKDNTPHTHPVKME